MSDIVERLTILHGQARRESGRSAVTSIGPNLLAEVLKEAADEIEYWRVEAEGERAKVERRDKQLARIASAIEEQVMIMDGEKCRVIIGFETPAKTQEAFDALGEATGRVIVTPPPRPLMEKP